MTNHEIHEPKDFSEAVRKIKTTDPAHADTFNPPFERLINNDVFLKNLTERLIQEHTHSGEDGEGSKIPLANVDVPSGLGDIVTEKELAEHVNERNPHGTRPSDIGAASQQSFSEHKAERATTSKAGHVTLNDSTDSSSTADAATANSVRKAYERAVEVDSRQVNYLEEIIPVDARSDSYPEGVSVMYINGLGDENSDWWNAINDVIDVDDNTAGHRLLVETVRSGTTRGGYQEVYVISNFAVDNGAVRYKLYRGSSFTINRDWQDFKLDFDIEGTDMKGILKAYPNTSYTVPQVRNLILSDEEPEGVFGDHGDIWMVYE